MNIERAILEGAGFQLVSAQCKNEDDVIKEGRDAYGVLSQYAPVDARAIDAFTRCRGHYPLRHRSGHRRR